jgi:pimeloyl-ACP methyl ester carboxylesterase
MTPASISIPARVPNARLRLQRRLRRGLALGTALVLAAGALFFYLHPIRVIETGIALRLRLAGVKSRYVMAEGYRIHYLEGGQGKPLLLIHGLGSRAEDWTPEIPAYIHAGFHVYAIDLLGCGRSPKPNIAYTITEQAEMVHAFLAALHLTDVDVAGWSMGGWVALKLAVLYPADVRRLVLMDSAGLLFQTPLTPAIFEPRTIPQLHQLMALLTPNPPSMPRFMERHLLHRMAANFPVVSRTVHSMLTGQDLLDGQLGQIHVPVLILWGSEDALIPPSVGAAMHAQIRGSQFTLISGCGHLAPARCWRRTTKAVLSFLQ